MEMEALEIAVRLSDINCNDVIIVAQALLDPDSQMLLTSDRKILQSKAFIREEKRLWDSCGRNTQLKIVDEL